jgi:hypothetical protein
MRNAWSMPAQAESVGVLARVRTPSSPVRERERERVIKREREREKEGERERGREREGGRERKRERGRDVEYGYFYF